MLHLNLSWKRVLAYLAVIVLWGFTADRYSLGLPRFWYYVGLLIALLVTEAVLNSMGKKKAPDGK